MKKSTHSLIRKFSLILGIIMTLIFLTPATEVFADSSPSEDIVILYTNDVHTYIDGMLSYDVIAAIKKDLQKKYKYVLLADAGDHIQGTAYGSMDKGESIIKLMNAAGYDVATLGNHEFDYNMQGCMDTIDRANFPYISCNFYHVLNGVRGDNVLDSYVTFNCGNEKLAFIGVTTPETFSKSTPAYFQNEHGEFIYNISAGDDGSALRQDVQKAIDEVKSAGATKIIALGHLGVDPSSTPWTSEETISGLSGLDAFIDGHSHTVIKGKSIKDKAGNHVLLTQTGDYFNRIGMMVIDSETGDISTDFIELEGNEEDGYTLSSEFYQNSSIISDAGTRKIKDEWLQKIDNQLGQKIGSFAVTFDNYDSENNRLVRSQETNSGDFAADALYYLFDNMDLDVDVAIMNGGGVRNKAVTGDVSYKTCKDMHPFGNVACLQTVTGQQLLDMLEWSTRHTPNEDGSFLHVSGLTYKINTSTKNTTVKDEYDVWVSGPIKYRVHDVKVYNKENNCWEPLNLSAKYNLAGYNYTLRDLGGGFAMLNGAVNVLDYVSEDYMVLANYIKGFENCTVDASNSPLLEKYPGLLVDYSNVNGSGRIKLVTAQGDSSQNDNNPPTGESSAIFLILILIISAGVIKQINKNKVSTKLLSVFIVFALVFITSPTLYAAEKIGKVDNYGDVFPDLNHYEKVEIEMEYTCSKCGTHAQGAKTMGHYCNINNDDLLVIYKDVALVDLKDAVKDCITVSVKVGVDVTVYDNQELYFAIYPERSPSYGPLVNVSTDYDCCSYYIALGGGAELRDKKQPIIIASGITSENVSLSNKNDLVQAKADYEAALNDTSSLSNEEITEINSNLSRINAALKVVENAENVINLISSLPEANDGELLSKVQNSANAYNLLTEYEKGLIPSDIKATLDDAIELLKAAGSDIPNITPPTTDETDKPVNDPNTGDIKFELVCVSIIFLFSGLCLVRKKLIF